MRWRRPTPLEIEFSVLLAIVLIAIGQMIHSGLSYLG